MSKKQNNILNPAKQSIQQISFVFPNNNRANKHRNIINRNDVKTMCL